MGSRTSFFDRRVLPRVGALALLLAACTGGSLASKAGDLGNGRFRYVCLNTSDAACANGQPPTTFPGILAVGSDFGIEYLNDDEDVPSGTISPASPEHVKATSRGFRVIKAGTEAMLARSTAGGNVVDFTHVSFVAPAKLRFSSASGAPARITMKVGDEQTLFATPVSFDGADIGGAITCDWTTSDGSILAFTLDGSTPTMGVVAKKPGDASISAAITGFAGTSPTTINITVTP